MANSPASDKKKTTMFLHADVLKIYDKIAEDESKKLGRTVTVPELIRIDGLKRANEVLAHRPDYRKLVGGQKHLDLDPSAGKYGATGNESVVRIVIRPGGKIEAFNKKGDQLSQWKRLDQIEEITAKYRVKAIEHEMLPARKRSMA